MSSRYILKDALKNLSAHKTRSLLTILGIVIAVGSIVLIVSMGNGAESLISGEIKSLGADIIWIEPGREPQGPTDFLNAALSNTLKEKDIDALRNPANVPGVLEISPAVSVPGSVSYQGETYRPVVLGFSGEFLGRVFNIYPEEGAYFSEESIARREKVVVIGAKVKEELFGESEAVGKTVKIKGENFRVVGVLPDQGQIFFFDIGEIAVIPYSTAQTYILGIDHYNEVWVRVKNVDDISQTIVDIEATLRDRHNITDPEKDDFYILTQDNLLDQIGSILDIMTAALGAIVTVALIVGGVGVMNIMLVSVTERTREIGLRKALGAREKDIQVQFLVEVIILTLTGGILGILGGAALSFAASFGISAFLGVNWTFAFPISAALLGVGVAALVGILFGYYPARNAAQKSPIEALRYD